MPASMELLLSGVQQSLAGMQQTVQQGQLSLQNSVENMRADVAKAVTHLEKIDVRNLNADQIHHDHEARLRTLEKIDSGAIEDMESRLRQLERFRYKLMGGSAVISVATGVGGALLEAWLSRH